MMPSPDTRVAARDVPCDEVRRASLAEETAATTPSVLIADGDPEVRAMLARTLRMLGRASVTAVDRSEATTLAGRHAASLELLIAEAGIPGLSGSELAQTVAALRPRVPVLLLSGARAPRDLADLVVGRPAAFLVKPVSADELCRAVSELTSS